MGLFLCPPEEGREEWEERNRKYEISDEEYQEKMEEWFARGCPGYHSGSEILERILGEASEAERAWLETWKREKKKAP